MIGAVAHGRAAYQAGTRAAGGETRLQGSVKYDILSEKEKKRRQPQKCKLLGSLGKELPF